MENQGFEEDTTLCKRTFEVNDEASLLPGKIKALVKEKEGEDVYPMNGEIKGEVLIVNISKYHCKGSTGERKGSENDVVKLKDVWTRLGHHVTIQRDLTAQNFKNEFVAFLTKRDFKGDCCTIFVMTHGKKDEVKPENVFLIMHDNQHVETDWIFEQLNSKNAANLTDKPKLLFLNTCRGGKMDAVRIFEEEMLDMEVEAMPIVPIYKNILLGFPCSPGCVAYRDENVGSYFIQTFIEVLNEDAEKDDMITMLQKVGRILLQLTDPSRIGYQTLCIQTFGFCKKLYLNPPQNYNKSTGQELRPRQ